MKIKAIHITFATLAIAIAFLGFMMIYYDVVTVPKYNKRFVYRQEEISICNLI